MAFMCADLSDISRWAQVDDPNYRIMRRLTPGPFCFVLPASREVPKILMMKRKQVGIRVPDHPVPQALIRELGNPIVSTSASWEGESLWDPADIAERFRALAMVLDTDGASGEPSTVIDLTGSEPEVLRAGAGVDRVFGG